MDSITINENHLAILSLSVLYLVTALTALQRDNSLIRIKHALGLTSITPESTVLHRIDKLRQVEESDLE